MWSLFKRKEDESFLNDYSGESLTPLKFSNLKTQEDIVKEVLEAIKQGNRIIFIKGATGTGKSAIALNLARHFSKTSIVVPIKSLQEQYEQDYTKSKFILKPDSKKLKISVIKGRNNFSCPFLNQRADNPELPCTLELKESNLEKIKSLLLKNKSLLDTEINSIKDVRRILLASSCPHWSPLLPSDINSRYIEDARKLKYLSVSGKEFALFQRKPGCKYYEQYQAYSDSDVLIFNSLKYIIETAIGRKPRTDIDIIDECDEFLDSFAQEETINLSRLSYALSFIYPENNEDYNSLKRINEKLNSILYDLQIDGMKKLEETEVLELIEIILENPYLAEDDEDNYYNRAFEISSKFSNFLNETYVSLEKKKTEKLESAYLTLVTINLAKRFSELANTTKALVMMSGTLHSPRVLADIFGISNYKIIEAEAISPGTIMKFRIGVEVNCKYENFKSGKVTREQYLKALEECVKKAKPPVLIHVTSFSDLPTELEKAEFHLSNLISREKLKETFQQKNIDKFKKREISILFTTKCSRGMDFPGEMCNSIILTRYPYPNISSPFWKILRQEHPDEFSEFYLDKSKRDLIQKIARGLRSKTDHILLLSPDVRVLNDSLR